MGNPAVDQFGQQLFAAVAAVIVASGVGGIILRRSGRWLERHPTPFVKNRRARQQTEAKAQPALSRVVLPHAPAGNTSAEGEASLDAIGWENFELLAGELFRRQGYEVEITAGLGADGGKDVTLRRDGQTRLVQCKNLRAGNKVTAGQMRDFFGLIVAEGAAGGIFMTTGTYSRDAREFAAGKPIELCERGDIERMIGSLARPGENLCDVGTWIDDFAGAARVADPSCPFCRSAMKLRRGPTGSLFWGCTRFATHNCRGKRDPRTQLIRARSYRGA